MGENERCETCKGQGFVPCPSHMVKVDPKWGTCWECDSPDVPGKISCEDCE